MKMVRLIIFGVWSLLVLLSCNGAKQDVHSEPASKSSSIGDSSQGQLAKANALRFQPLEDQWDKSGTMATFKAKLLQDLEAGDQTHVLNAFSNILEFNPGTAAGPDGVVELWKLNGGTENLIPLKSLLVSLLSNGGCFSSSSKDSIFNAPYYNCLTEVDESRCEESGCGVVIQAGAKLRQSPDSSAIVMATLSEREICTSYSDTLCDAHFSNCTWRKVTRSNGEKGFLPSTNLRTESDGYLRLVKEKQWWKIRVLRASGIPSDDA